MRSPVRCFISVGVVLTAGWLLFFTAGETIARAITKAAGGVLLRLSDGKFNDPQLFVAGRIREILWISTIALLLALAAWMFDRGAQRVTFYKQARGVWLGSILFVAVNVWWATAARTVTMWCLFYHRGGVVDNHAQFQIKKYLNPEVKAKKHVVLFGNSQVNTNIDERILNRLLAPDIWTTEMHQPGTCGFDATLLLRNLREMEADLFVDYVSPVPFYSGTNGMVISRNLRWRDLPDLVNWGGTDKLPHEAIKMGLAGRLIPLARDQASISQRVLGGAIISLSQQVFDSSLEADLGAQASRRRNGLRMGPVAEFEKHAFAQGIAETVARGRRFLLIMGSHHPTAESLMDPRIRPDFEAFINSLQDKHPGSVFVLPESELIQVNASDFADLVHWKEETRTRFSQSLAGEIPRYLESSTANLSGPSSAR